MVSNLPEVIDTLLTNEQVLLALPIIAVLEWLAQHICRDVSATVAVRCQRAQAAVQLGLLADAAAVLASLMLVSASHMTASQTVRAACLLVFQSISAGTHACALSPLWPWHNILWHIKNYLCCFKK